ncbi:MAG: Nif3-like dinuclear metal center hexameric protein [Kiritimatiellae bacterium]|nr:Nif3-like dinuclear metal center hexameric protein [Kiritimatiellia bacterium]
MGRRTACAGKVALERVVAELDSALRIADFRDDSHNGLQVTNRTGSVTRVCCGVDASLPFFEKAAAQGADLLICHHGLSWGDSLKRITGLNYRLLAFLIEHGMALWACHLPLDAHPVLGNNACICHALGLRERRPFGDYHGQTIGFHGHLPRPLSRAAFAARLRDSVSPRLRVMPFGPDRIRTVGVISGGAAAEIAQAATAGLDAYVSGETTLHGYNLAQQLGVNAFFGGHYATEHFGVQAVGAWLQRRFQVPATFVNLDIPF